MKNSCLSACFILLLVIATLEVMAQPMPHASLKLELQSLLKQLVPDKRVALLEIEINDTLQPLVVSGETDLPDAKMQIIQFLNSKKIEFIDSIRLLPSVALGDKIWALATSSVSNLRAKPDDASELVSQVMMGTPLKVLDYNNKWYRIQTPEHYIGWMDAGGLQQLTDKEMEQWRNSNRYLYHCISGFVYDAPGKKGAVVSDLVLGSLFEVETTVKGFLKIRIPDGRSGYVRKTECLSFEEWRNTEPTAQSIIEVARKMMGFPYLWGGASSKAIDCSGFVKLAYYAYGIILARDASQQAQYGEVIDFSNSENLQPGDLLFFGRTAQRITHVGIYLGNGNFIHSSGKVHISSIDPSDPKYVPTRNLVASRRIMNSLYTQGIVRVKEHEWYNP
jgi:SH3-like domain-containing protein